MGIADTTGTQLTVHQICFKEYIKYLKYKGDSGHNGDRTYSTTTTTTTTTNNNIIIIIIIIIIYYYYYYYIIIIIIISSSSSSICYTVSCVPVVSAIPIVLKIFLLLRSDGISNYFYSVADTRETAGNSIWSLFKLIFLWLFSFSMGSFRFESVFNFPLKLI